MSECNHKLPSGTPDVGLVSEPFGDFSEVSWECGKCGQTLTHDEELALKLPPASEAWNESEQDRADQQADYERSRGSNA